MTAPLIIIVIILAAVIVALDYHNRHRADEQEQPLFDSAKLQSEIAALYKASQELETLDSMIIDLRLCKPSELHKAFRIEWQGSTKSHSLDFMSTGDNSNTAHMLALAVDQREELNAEIQGRIAALYSRAQEIEFEGKRRLHFGERNGERT